MPLLRSFVVCSVLGLFPHAASACGIIVRPVDAVPAFGSGQRFSTRAEDCETVLFTFEGRALTKEATVGSGPGALDVYEVVLSPEELRSLTGPGVVTLRWGVSALGASPGDHAWIHQVSEIDLDRDGWTRSEGDVALCDSSPTRNPGVEEICDNGVDDDCDGEVDDCALDLQDADAIVEGPVYQGWLGSTLAVADVNGDGVADLLSGAPGFGRDTGLAYVSFGPVSGTVVAGDDVTITPDDSQALGESLAGGDADGDGFGDVLVGSFERSNVSPVSLFLGPIAGEVSAADDDLELTAPRLNIYFGYHLEITPDLDGDAESDIILTAPSALSWDGAVYVVPGTTTGSVFVERVATYVFTSPVPDGTLGIDAIALDDADGDGIDEIAMTDGYAVYVVPGGIPSGDYDASTVATATIALTPRWWYGWDAQNLAGIDADQDGYGDLVIGDADAQTSEGQGRASLLLGPIAGSLDAQTDAVAAWRGNQVGALVDAGDCNGDGDADFLLGGVRDVYLSLGPAEGIVDAESLPVFPVARFGGTPEGAVLFAPDWSGDGVQEIVLGVPGTRTDAGASAGGAHVFYSDRF